MAITKKRKEELVSEYVQLLQRSQGLILSEYRGLNMTAIDAVRGRVRGARQGGDYQGEFHITKNTLLGVALQQVGWPVPEEVLTGPTAVAFLFGDLKGLTKGLLDYTRENDHFIIKGGLLQDMALRPDEVRQLSELPSREQLLAQIMGTLQAPLSQLLGMVATPVRELAYVLQQKAEQGGAPAPEAAPAP